MSRKLKSSINIFKGKFDLDIYEKKMIIGDHELSFEFTSPLPEEWYEKEPEIYRRETIETPFGVVYVERINGVVTVRSEGVGHPSCYIWKLPVLLSDWARPVVDEQRWGGGVDRFIGCYTDGSIKIKYDRKQANTGRFEIKYRVENNLTI